MISCLTSVGIIRCEHEAAVDERLLYCLYLLDDVLGNSA